VNFDQAQHVFIEGENLEVLKVLQKAYFGKVKLIYIDPPYNTGSDSFIYPDRFQESKEDYLKRINDLADDGTLMREGFFRKNSKERRSLSQQLAVDDAAAPVHRPEPACARTG
jgi:adenine-specific DNA-methyltransferase